MISSKRCSDDVILVTPGCSVMECRRTHRETQSLIRDRTYFTPSLNADSQMRDREQTPRRIAVIGIAFLAIVAMAYVPPWSEYQVHLRDPLEPVTDYKLLPTYAWRDQPPFSQGQGHGFTINHQLLLLQMLAVGLLAAGLSFGKRGLIGFGLPVVGGLLGMQAPFLVIEEPVAHSGGAPTAIFVIMGITGMIGMGIGLAIARGIIRSLPAPTQKMEPAAGHRQKRPLRK
jgi:hypothetical protein